jgi:peptidoglycan hydrolase-like protein with peptidoglycan-binding domain
MKQPRPVKEGDHGLDVKAYKRALRKAGFYHEPKTRGQFGPRMTAATKHFQKSVHLRQTGRIGKPTFEKLQPHIDLFGRSLLRAYRVRHRHPPDSPTAGGVRRAMKREMDWGLTHEPQIHYPPGDVRREPNNVPIDKWNSHTLPVELDCSQAATAVAKRAGAPDPTGSNWGHGPGALFTGTMLTHCRAIHKRDLQVGDYVVYGPATGDHVSVVNDVSNHDDPLLWSHGFEGGPLLIRLSAQTGMHRAPVRFLSAGI